LQVTPTPPARVRAHTHDGQSGGRVRPSVRQNRAQTPLTDKTDGQTDDPRTTHCPYQLLVSHGLNLQTDGADAVSSRALAPVSVSVASVCPPRGGSAGSPSSSRSLT